MRTITESYFGSELTPIEIIKTKYGNIYVCESKGFNKPKIVFYDENGSDPMELSYIDIDEFEATLLLNLKSSI